MGDLEIRGDNIVSLEPLKNLSSISGELVIMETSLKNLEGLDNLETLGSDLWIRDNSQLTDLTGLRQLSSVLEFNLINNQSLTNVTGLESLTLVRGDLTITYNNQLTSLSGFRGQISTRSSVYLQFNPKLKNLIGLEGITRLYYLSIQYHSGLESLQGLNNLVSLSKGVDIYSNDQLKNLSGLEKFQSVEGDGIYIGENKNLNSLSGLISLKQTPILSIYRNSSLSQCAIDPICLLLANSNTQTQIEGNAPGCSSVVDIQADCAPLTITTQPADAATVCAGASVSTSVGVSGNARTYQWYRNGLVLPQQNQPTLALTGVKLSDAGSYSVVVSNSVSSDTSAIFQLTVNELPAVSINPSSTAVCASTPAILNASGAATYQWQGPGGLTSTASSVTVSTSGTYSVIGITSAACSASATASVTVYDVPPTPVIKISQAVTQPILQNTPYVTLTVSGCSDGTISWQGPGGVSGNGTSIPVSTSATGNFAYSATCQVGFCTSLPGNLTVAISPPLVSGSFDGFVNGADCSTFRGWAWDRNKVNTPVSVDILDGPTVIATLLADVFRPDLQTAGKGNGKHAFSWNIPENLKDGLTHNLSARVSGSSFILKDSPKALVCQGSSSPANKAPVPPSPTILVAPLAAQVGVPFSGTLVAFTDPEGQSLTYALSGLPDGLSINMLNRLISGTPTQSGTFVLAYSATDGGGLTNSVSFPLTVNPASTTAVTGDFEGYLDKLDCGGIRGWVWDRKKPNTPLTVEFYLDGSGTVLGSTVANIFRQDLKDAGKGNGSHAYNFSPPGSLTNGTMVRARVLGSTYELKGSPKAYQCAPARLSAESGSELQVTVLGNPVSDQLQVEIRGAEGQELRLHFTDAAGCLLHQRQIEAARVVEHQRFSVQGQPSGLLLLRVSSGLKSVTVKVLKQ
ncbi:hypothetical protein GCM10028804_00080 [Larkinella terrae]